MEKLKQIINLYGRWSALIEYVDRIETYQNTDFSQSFENAKALLESIGKEICFSKGIPLDATSNISQILKKAFLAIGYSGDNIVTQISSSLANIGHQIGELRNKIGTTSHGRSLEELRERNNKVDELTKEFLIDSTSIIACFLIRSYENKNPRVSLPKETKILYEDNPAFNNLWDELYGDFEMGDYSYSASEILYNIDYLAYVTELSASIETEEDDD